MAVLINLGLGLSVALDPTNLACCFIGVLIGTLVGVLPGLGPPATIALLLPLTFQMQATAGIIMLAGIYYGAQYGGSITSILLNLPGEPSTIITCLEGYQMTLKGRSGPALGISAFGSFIAGTLAVIGLMIFAPILGKAALSFGPMEYFGLTFIGITLIVYLTRGSAIKALTMATFGLLLGSIGADPISGESRFSYGSSTLIDGLGLVPIAMGMFGIAEILNNLDNKFIFHRESYKKKIKGLLPNIKDWKDSLWPIIRGSFIGFFIGIIPGPSALVGSFASYSVEKKISRHPENFGTGVIEGVAGPEASNNAAATGAFIPLLSLGIPGNVVMALFMGTLMVHGIQPGPLFITGHPEIFWGIIASMYIGNFMLLALNLPLIGLWVKFLKIPYVFLFPLIFLLCLIGVYTLNNNIVEIFIMLIFAIIGFLMRKTGFEGAPFILALVLGPIMESSFRQSLVLSHGNLWIFFSRPVSAILMLIGLVFLVMQLIPAIRKGKEKIASD